MQVAAGRIGDLRRTGGLEGTLREMMLRGAGTPRRLKTFTAEMEGAGPPRSRHASIRWDSRPAGIDGISVVTCRDGRGDLPECELVLDRRQGRFCMLHTAEEDAVAEGMVSTMAYTTQLNRAWVCPSVLAKLAGSGSGTSANSRHGANESVRMHGDDPEGHASADVRCDGVVSHAGGESVGAHLQTASRVLAASAELCANAERFRIGAVNTPEGTHFHTTPIDVILSRKIDDVPMFVDRTFDGAPPLLMEGKAIHVEGDQYHAPIVDLECAHSVGMDIAPELVSVSLHRGRSGSGILRLLSHLQAHQDPNLACDRVFAESYRA